MDATEFHTTVSANGTTTRSQLENNRVQVVLDEKQFEFWEQVVIEDGKAEPLIFLLSYYLCRGEKQISPEIPKKPIDEMTARELAQVRGSKAYKIVRHFKTEDLEKAAQAIKQTAGTGIDPN